MSDKYSTGQKRNVNINTAKSCSKNPVDYLGQNLIKRTSSLSSKLADLKNGNYVDYNNKTDDSKLRTSTKYGNQNNTYSANRLISFSSKNNTDE